MQIKSKLSSGPFDITEGIRAASGFNLIQFGLSIHPSDDEWEGGEFYFSLCLVEYMPNENMFNLLMNKAPLEDKFTIDLSMEKKLNENDFI